MNNSNCNNHHHHTRVKVVRMGGVAVREVVLQTMPEMPIPMLRHLSIDGPCLILRMIILLLLRLLLLLPPATLAATNIATDHHIISIITLLQETHHIPRRMAVTTIMVW